MDKEAALKILQQLANGTDPHTGEVFPADSPYQHPDTVRALYLALRELTAQSPSRPRTAGSDNAPQNAGKPWTADEDRVLAAGFDGGKQIPELAGTTPALALAIEARLAKLGKIPPPPNMRVHKAESAMAAYGVTH